MALGSTQLHARCNDLSKLGIAQQQRRCQHQRITSQKVHILSTPELRKVQSPPGEPQKKKLPSQASNELPEQRPRVRRNTRPPVYVRHGKSNLRLMDGNCTAVAHVFVNDPSPRCVLLNILHGRFTSLVSSRWMRDLWRRLWHQTRQRTCALDT